MEENNREISERLDQMEKVLSELSRRVDALEGNKIVKSATVAEKKPKGKVFLRICIPILILCLIAGGVYYVLSNRKPAYVEPEIGDVITFGHYEQNHSEADGLEPIEWIVFEKQDGKILLLSKYNLFTETFSSTMTSWSGSKIRKTLNEDFISSAFSSQEQSRICTIDYTDEQGLFHDNVFLLSEDEVERYFPTAESRKAFPTETCIVKENNYQNNAYKWWTSTTTDRREYVFVNTIGEIDKGSISNVFGIRPALWLDTTK